MNTVFFSVIIPTYNRAAFIKKSVDSVLSQSFQDWELIIVDDASTDNTLDILQSYSDKRIKVLKNEVNLERSASRNKAIAAATGTYICLLDSDDYFLDNHLEVLYNAIQDNNKPVAFFHTGVEQFYVNTGKTVRVERISSANPVETAISFHIPVITVAIHRDIFKEFQFDKSMRINEDVYLFALISAKYPVIYTPEITVRWVLHGNNTADQEKDALSPQLLATRKIFNDSRLKPFISSSFRKNKYMNLYSELVHFHAVNKRHLKALLYFIQALSIDPFNKKNKTNFLNCIYHWPVVRVVKNRKK